MKKVLFVLLMALNTMVVCAQSADPVVEFYSREEETEERIVPGGSASAQAPLELTMTANVDCPSGYTYKCEWRLYRTKDGAESPLMNRFDDNTTYTLTFSDSYSIKLYVTFMQDEEEIDWESEPFIVVITESQLSCPDGFSPNGDGINDYFKITFKSIVKMDGAIINRWGQKLHTFTLDNAEEGWDGRYAGSYVKDGVYFLNLYAKGSDGVEYKIKKAVNVLKGYRENSEGTVGGGE